MESESDEIEVENESETDEVEEGKESETDEVEDGKESETDEMEVEKESEIEMGKAVRNQLRIWDSLLCLRIRVQKVLVAANKLPSPTLLDEIGDDLHKNISYFNGAVCATKQFSSNLLDLQEMLVEQNSETKKILSLNKSDNTGMNEEITSSEDEPEPSLNLDMPSSEGDDEETANQQAVEHALAKTEMKELTGLRKKHTRRGNFKDAVCNRFQSLIPFRNETIEKWNTKTEVASGKFKNKGSNFSSFHISALKQINQVLSDKERLIKRTQLKRSQYTSIGDSEAVKKRKTDDGDTETNGKTEQTDYNEEIFDDDDFYHQLLREVIERKASDVEDSTDMNSRWLELQKLRGKNKRKVDTKSSKGRKIRYTVHNKLVNFMASYDSSPMTEGAYKELLNSLFSSG